MKKVIKIIIATFLMIYTCVLFFTSIESCVSTVKILQKYNNPIEGVFLPLCSHFICYVSSLCLAIILLLSAFEKETPLESAKKSFNKIRENIYKKKSSKKTKKISKLEEKINKMKGNE